MDALNREEWLSRIAASRARLPGAYLAMYSSWWQGIVTDPSLMLVPVDDHMVHRGDGIFEAARVVDGAIFDLDAHLARLENSAARISLALPNSLAEIHQLCVATAKMASKPQAAMRIFVGRGVGSFSPNPYEPAESSLAIVVTDFKPISEEKFKRGATAVTSRVPQKDPFYAQIKSLNYLPNVLMKKEAVDQGVDFSLGVGAHGQILEGSTENLAVLSEQGELLVPKFDYTLRGTTLLVVLDDLNANPHPFVRRVVMRDITIEELRSAREAFMIGTTLEVLPVVAVDGFQIGAGTPGDLALGLRQRLRQTMSSDSRRRTELAL